MPKLPIISYNILRNKVKKLGYIEIRTKKHPVYYNPLNGITLPIPFHDGDVPKGTLRVIINELGLTVGEFINIK
ncbi:MAG: type II toxin-antitoxin system HicA family toxin [Candidatus Gracilibacteria bacterium]|nr:type II toxin-antitoxin system HicA family toxin [Candidatus Gracilibacteria bacterium]MDD3120173.1 type II toxin-antitoxin system HicA family toxin [Candidatus Gracilibacteria bacterium]MDD4530249.1 type II toxin-antitoxin system HicA family toxin [Candidatus Gracilibacteria bacterium]